MKVYKSGQEAISNFDKENTKNLSTKFNKMGAALAN
jgi:hypothetical protein